MHQNFIIPYLYEAQQVSGDTPPIIRSLKLHWQPETMALKNEFYVAVSFVYLLANLMAVLLRT